MPSAAKNATEDTKMAEMPAIVGTFHLYGLSATKELYTIALVKASEMVPTAVVDEFNQNQDEHHLVARHEVGPIIVVTLFSGIKAHEKDFLFETFIFGLTLEDGPNRWAKYSLYDEAMAGHHNAVAWSHKCLASAEKKLLPRR